MFRLFLFQLKKRGNYTTVFCPTVPVSLKFDICVIFIVNPTLSTSLKQIESEGELINDGILGDEFHCLFLILIGETRAIRVFEFTVGLGTVQ